MEIEAKQESSKYLSMELIGKQRNTWDIVLAKLCHLTDPECTHYGPKQQGGGLEEWKCHVALGAVACSSLPMTALLPAPVQPRSRIPWEFRIGSIILKRPTPFATCCSRQAVPHWLYILLCCLRLIHESWLQGCHGVVMYSLLAKCHRLFKGQKHLECCSSDFK